MRTTTYRAPDKRRGYTGGEIAAILYRHHPASTVLARVGFRGQVQQLVVDEPETDPVTDEQLAAEVDAFNRRAHDHEAECELPPPPPEHLDRTVRDEVELNGIARATEAEELVREELHAAGIDVAAVENAVRRAQGRTSGGTR